ncbi:MAG: DUF1330 domain-containing protein [Acidimicrobiales bacterium]
MPAYFIACSDVIDRDELNRYLAGAPASMAGREIKVLVFDEQTESVEGKAPHRTVVLEFPDKAAAMDWYNSDVYQAVVGHRLAATANGFAALVQGFGS